jgi:site-specific recombinase XerD
MVKRLDRRADLERTQLLTPDVLRHTHATEPVNLGFTIREVQELLGREDIRTTMQYTHLVGSASDGVTNPIDLL